MTLRGACRLLRLVYSHYDANYLLSVFDMHLCSSDQLTKLMQAAGAPTSYQTILDVGAADGVLAALAPAVCLLSIALSDQYVNDQYGSDQ